MRLIGISLQNFLSFDHLEWSGLDPSLNIIVGPNGVGKTNLFRAVRAASDVLSYESRHLLRGASRCDSESTSFRISLDVDLDGAWEREFLCAFVRAALWDQLSSQALQNRPPTQRGFNAGDVDRLAELVRAAVRPDNMSWLLRGRLNVMYEAEDTWHLSYESLPHVECGFRWSLEGFGGDGISAVEDASGSYSISGVLTGMAEDQWASLVLLDEPALNLHPTTQSAVIKEIAARGQNQFIVITHSPVMVPPESIHRVSRFVLGKVGTLRHALDPDGWGPKDLAATEKELRESVNVASLLFSRAVILTEGVTEPGVLSLWFERASGQPLERQAVAIHHVGGDQNFETYLRLLHAFAIPWAIVCDGKVVTHDKRRGPQKSIALQMKNAGVANLQDFDQIDFPARCEILARNGVFTLALSCQDEIEALPVIKDNRREAKGKVGRSKARRGRYIADRADCAPEVAALFKQLAERLGISWSVAGPPQGSTGGYSATQPLGYPHRVGRPLA